MAETPSRMLRLLSLLQNCRDWPGGKLAERLDVSPRTLRRDIERLRDLGYPVNAIPGVGGGYRLEAGADLPPLLLDDDEAVAIAVGLRTAAGGSVADIEETSIRALAKLEQVLPKRLRSRVNALQMYTVPMFGVGPTANPGYLASVAQACRDRQRLRFTYRKRDGETRSRLVEPYRLVHVNRKWYLLSWDTEREDWRTFRMDRMDAPLITGVRFQQRELPAEDAAAYVAQSITSSLANHRALVTLYAPFEVVAERIRPRDGILTVLDERTCQLRTAADTLEWLALTIGMFGIDFEVHEPPELVAYVRELSDRLARAATPREPRSPSPGASPTVIPAGGPATG
ncbi:YafY family protein [Streptomyces sp. CA-278952]|uniref:helix-turn-helix transcriptional regulator n=1 Tax=unclassified Streptomyces TaxID=2593676 RepID=UPI0022423932|nr:MULTISPECIES: YafY family protein [unclassified Streptomyces]UZI28572.1 YafY family transcriptional regulator [Streptomyces sp. VB1]WDG28510.1 YafY family protein [Streptomyces sp. CA-278952]